MGNRSIMYRVTQTIVYEIDEEYGVAVKKAENLMREMIGTTQIQKTQLRLEKVKYCLIKLGEFVPEEVLSFVGNKKQQYQINDKVYHVKMNSHRYFIFKKSLQCVSCGIMGSKMILEQHTNDKSPHFNLYAVEDNKLILMTKDHIQPKSKGGKDVLDNYATMCEICNNLKANYLLNCEQLKELRTIYNSGQHLSKKNLRKLIESYRCSLLVA